jgi:phage terminase large subunit-like protein
MNYIKEYVKQIDKGKVVVSKRVDKIYRKLLKDIDNPKEWHFDEERAIKPINFIEKFCKQSKGEWIGKSVELQLFQKAFISALFGFTNKEGVRRFKETFFLVARKNGKSTLLSGIQLYMLVADGEGGAECYSVATKKDQARITFSESVNMVKQSPYLSKHLKKRKTDIYFPLTFGKIEALASDSNSLDGLNSHCIVMDELHAIKDRALYEVMKQSMSARRQPLMVMITTSGTVRECIYDDMYEYACGVVDGTIPDDRFLPILYELDSREEWTDFKAWEKANPGLGTIKKYDDLVEKVERAKANPKDLPGILCKDFNVRENVSGSWLTFEEINNTETYNIADFKGTYAVGGVDLSSTTDLTCATLLWKKEDKFYVNQMYFIPREIAEQKEQEDKVPYKIWEQQGHITFTEGVRVDYSDVTTWFKKMRDKYEIFPLWIGYDNWNAQYFTIEMQNNNFVMEQVIQGAKTMSPAMKELEAQFKSRNINYNNNSILKWNLTNTQIKQDDNDNIRPVKGKNAKQRIDGTVSLVDAFVIYMRHYEDYNNLL